MVKRLFKLQTDKSLDQISNTRLVQNKYLLCKCASGMDECQRSGQLQKFFLETFNVIIHRLCKIFSINDSPFHFSVLLAKKAHKTKLYECTLNPNEQKTTKFHITEEQTFLEPKTGPT